VPDHALRPRAGSSAKALLLTVLGELVLPAGGAAWTRTLVDVLGALDVEEKNARQALARTAAQGFVAGERDGRSVRWRLTEAGDSLLRAGTRRIYGFGANGSPWDGRWLVVLCPVAEDQRPKRQQLRRRLSFAGFGFLSPAVALSPHLRREADATQVLRELDLADAAVVLRAEAGDLVPAGELLRRAWDIDALAAGYREAIACMQARPPRDDDAELVALVRLVHRWRRFPFEDPELPVELLPARWPGGAAKALLDERHHQWAPAGHDRFAELESRGP
jgi:phenylacetic acid degradation operon negative regulatory protein